MNEDDWKELYSGPVWTSTKDILTFYLEKHGLFFFDPLEGEINHVIRRAFRMGYHTGFKTGSSTDPRFPKLWYDQEWDEHKKRMEASNQAKEEA